MVEKHSVAMVADHKSAKRLICPVPKASLWERDAYGTAILLRNRFSNVYSGLNPIVKSIQ